MFKNYVADETLSLNDYNNIMKNDCPDGHKYCNAFCQKFLKAEEFHKDRASCKVFDVDVETIINSTKGIMSMLGIDYTEEENLVEYNEQIDVDFD
jgi:hypothetical protein